jgi:hypothetical protein
VSRAVIAVTQSNSHLHLCGAGGVIDELIMPDILATGQPVSCPVPLGILFISRRTAKSARLV